MDSSHGNPSPSDPMESVCRHFPPQAQHHFDVYLLKSLANWLAVSPMESWHGNPSPSDPMESVCRHFPPQAQHHFDVYLLSLSQTDLRWVRWTLVTSTRLQRIRWSPFANIVHSSHKNFDVYLLSLSRNDFRWVWLLLAFVNRTPFGCTGQPSKMYSSLFRFVFVSKLLFIIVYNSP